MERAGGEEQKKGNGGKMNRKGGKIGRKRCKKRGKGLKEW
jgi:hypothetical protein